MGTIMTSPQRSSRRGNASHWLIASAAMLVVAVGVTYVMINRPGPPRYSELRVGVGTPQVLVREQPKLIIEVDGEEFRRSMPVVEFDLQPGDSLDPRVKAGPFKAAIIVPLILGEPSQGKIVVEYADCDVKIIQGGRILAETVEGNDEERLETGVIMVPAGTIDLRFELQSTGPAPRFRTGWAVPGTRELEAITRPPSMERGRSE